MAIRSTHLSLSSFQARRNRHGHARRERDVPDGQGSPDGTDRISAHQFPVSVRIRFHNRWIEKRISLKIMEKESLTFTVNLYEKLVAIFSHRNFSEHLSSYIVSFGYSTTLSLSSQLLLSIRSTGRSTESHPDAAGARSNERRCLAYTILGSAIICKCPPYSQSELALKF